MHLWNIVGMVFDSGVNVVCCGEEMEELYPTRSRLRWKAPARGGN